ncbi:MAG: Transposase, IS4 family protein, partial [Clostridia bacterium 62_21]
DEMPPDHSILSKARARFGREVYEQFFREVVRMCREAGLVEGDKVFLDATLLKANASLDSLVEREVCHRLKETPEAYLDRVWEENPWRALTTRAGAVPQVQARCRGKRPGRRKSAGKARGPTRSG